MLCAQEEWLHKILAAFQPIDLFRLILSTKSRYWMLHFLSPVVFGWSVRFALEADLYRHSYCWRSIRSQLRHVRCHVAADVADADIAEWL